MNKPILPIYHTGWFYLLLLFWGFSFWYVSIGGLNVVNQLTSDWLKQPAATLDNNMNLVASEVLTVQSDFNEPDITDVTALLSYHKNSQVVLLGQPSSAFIKKLKAYLSRYPRNNKIIIDSKHVSSASPLKPQATMIFSPLLNWFRFSSQPNAELLISKHFIFSPLLQNERQSFPLVWQQQGKLYLSLPGELLRQLSQSKALHIKQDWQLTLINQTNLTANQLPLGFFGEVFVSAELPTAKQLANEKQLQKQSTTNDARLITANEFMKQYSLTSHTNKITKYKVIIITDNHQSLHKILPPLVNKLLQNDYRYQSLLTVLCTWLLLLLAIVLIGFMSKHPLKQQSIIIFSYIALLIVAQYVLFTLQQWLEIMPIIMVMLGTWLFAFAYQREYKLFQAALNYQHKSQITTTTKNTSKDEEGSILIKKLKKAVNYRKLLSFNKSSSVAKKPINNALATQAAVEYKQVQSTSLSESETSSEPPISQGTSVESIGNKGNHTQTISLNNSGIKSFGRYQVEAILGKGAMGIVYQGVDPKINRHVAIKTLQLSDEVDSPEFEQAKQRFFREAQTAGGLSHANIVTIYDVGEDNHLGYIAMDLLTGAPLSLFTQPGQTLPIPLVYQLLTQITDALDYAHRQNVVHRDIKPANIIYDDDLLKVTVTDFGIAYVSDHSKTRTGIIMGSPYYMSPEQILGLQVDGRSDIFSLGVTFYQLLCGHLPFEGESIAAVAYQITQTKATAVNQHNTKLPISAVRICNKAMHKDIEKRYQSMAEFKLALTSALKKDFNISTS